MIFGIMVDTLGFSQLAFNLIKELNKLRYIKENYDVAVFYHDHDIPTQTPQFAIYPEKDLVGFRHTILATSLATATRLISCPTATRKILYVYDLEWIHNIYSFKSLSDIYRNKELELAARSSQDATLINKLWKQPTSIIHDFNINELIQLA